MNKLLLFAILVVVSLRARGQSIAVNYDIDTNVVNVAKPLNLWLDFLRSADDAVGTKYWNSSEVAKYGPTAYFLVEKELEFGTDNFLMLLRQTDITILAIVKVEDYYKITSMMEFKPSTNTAKVNYIFHVYAAMENGELKLRNPLEINTKLYLNSSTVGQVNYHYPKAHKFDDQLARKQSDYLLKLSKDFQVDMIEMDYYFAPTYDEVLKIRGFDFLVGQSGEEIPTGKADPENKIAYAAGTNEYYPHELIHLLLNPHYPACHLWINEGVATFFGMSRGKPLEWHLNRLNTYLLEHPDIDLNNMLKLRSLDQYTGFRYVLGGYIVEKAFLKGSYQLVKKLMQAGSSDEDFYNAIDCFLGITRNKLNEYIRDDLQQRFK